MWWLGLLLVAGLGPNTSLGHEQGMWGTHPVGPFWIYPSLVHPAHQGPQIGGEITARRPRQLSPLSPLSSTDHSDIPDQPCTGGPNKLFTECRLPRLPDQNDVTLHDFTTENLEKTLNVSLSSYAGQILLVVNLAGF